MGLFLATVIAPPRMPTLSIYNRNNFAGLLFPPRCLRGLFTMSSIQFAPYTRLTLLETSHRYKHVFSDSYFVIFYHQCVLDLHASDKRAPYSHIIGYLEPAYPPHYGLSTKRLPLLAEKVHSSGARGVLFTAFLPHPGCMSLAAISWLYISSTTIDYAVTLRTLSPIRCSYFVPRFVLEPRSLYPRALPSSAGPAVLFAGDGANLSPFEQPAVHPCISETADIQYMC